MRKIPPTKAEERYRHALLAGKTIAEAEWTRDNPPGICSTHPDRPSLHPTRRRCRECVTEARAANLARELAKMIESTCQKCLKRFTSLKKTARLNCPECHAAPGGVKVQPIVVKKKAPPSKPVLAPAKQKPVVSAPPPAAVTNPNNVQVTRVPSFARDGLRDLFGTGRTAAD